MAMLPLDAIHHDLNERGLNFSPIQLDPDTFRAYTTRMGTYLSCTLDEPHVIRVGTLNQTHDIDLTEPTSIDKIMELVTCTKFKK